MRFPINTQTTCTSTRRGQLVPWRTKTAGRSKFCRQVARVGQFLCVSNHVCFQVSILPYVRRLPSMCSETSNRWKLYRIWEYANLLWRPLWGRSLYSNWSRCRTGSPGFHVETLLHGLTIVGNVSEVRSLVKTQILEQFSMPWCFLCNCRHLQKFQNRLCRISFFGTSSSPYKLTYFDSTTSIMHSC